MVDQVVDHDMLLAGVVGVVPLLLALAWALRAAFRAAAQSRLRQQMSQQSRFEAAAFAQRVQVEHEQVKASAVKLGRCIRELGNLTGQAGRVKQTQLEHGVIERLNSAKGLATQALTQMRPDALASASTNLQGIRSTMERQCRQIQTQCARIKEKDTRHSSGVMASLR